MCFSLLLIPSSCCSDWLLCDWIHWFAFTEYFCQIHLTTCWMRTKCRHLIFCWNLKREQFLTLYFQLLLLIIYISFNYWLMNKWTVKRMCAKFVDLLHAHGMASAKQYNQSTHNTKKVIQYLPTMHRNNITIKTIYISQIENLIEWK